MAPPQQCFAYDENIPSPFPPETIAQRIIGKLIKDVQKAGEIASQNTGGNIFKCTQEEHLVCDQEERTTPATLEEIGLTRKQSSIYQQLADIPEDKNCTGKAKNTYPKFGKSD